VVPVIQRTKKKQGTVVLTKPRNFKKQKKISKRKPNQTAIVTNTKKHAAATKIQSRHRTKTAKKDKERMLKEDLSPSELKEVKILEKQIAKEEAKQKALQNQEKRIDDNDGREKTILQFQKKYNGLKEWNNSITRAQMLGQDNKEMKATKKKIPKKKDFNKKIAERTKLMQMTSGIELKALPFKNPKSIEDASSILDKYRERELDLLEFQQLQSEKMSTLRKKAEKTVGSLSQEIEMMSSDLTDMRTQVTQETKQRKKEERNRRTAEADAERLRRELRAERDELRLAVAKETELQIERDRLDAVLSKVGAGALDDLEARLQASEERRWQSEAEIEKLRTELNWQTNGRMDERLAVAQMEEELSNIRSAKRKMEVKRMQLDESLEQCMTQLRSKKRECGDYRKRLDALLQQKGTGVLKGRFGGAPRIRQASGSDMIDDPIKPRKGGRRAVLPPSVKRNGRQGGRGQSGTQELDSLRRKITTLRQKVSNPNASRTRFGM